jgi:hypothetical protein
MVRMLETPWKSAVETIFSRALAGAERGRSLVAEYVGRRIATSLRFRKRSISNALNRAIRSVAPTIFTARTRRQQRQRSHLT